MVGNESTLKLILHFQPPFLNAKPYPKGLALLLEIFKM